jgi:hypothetical protein
MLQWKKNHFLIHPYNKISKECVFEKNVNRRFKKLKFKHMINKNLKWIAEVPKSFLNFTFFSGFALIRKLHHEKINFLKHMSHFLYELIFSV